MNSTTTTTTILVRRVKQGVAEWFRLQIKEKAWAGLREHSLDGWNIGPAPYGYLANKVNIHVLTVGLAAVL